MDAFFFVGIEPWTFLQKLGDAVFIPAGCPHQVRNLKVFKDFLAALKCYKFELASLYRINLSLGINYEKQKFGLIHFYGFAEAFQSCK